MTSFQLTLPLPASDPAFLILPQPPTTASLRALEQAIWHTLRGLQGELGGDAPDAGDIEYASWLQALRS